MSIKKNWRTTLLVLLITFTFTSVIGGTMAWFTDTVESSSNVIEAGTLDAGLYYSETYNGDQTVWTDASSGAIFNHRLWEPGYTQVRYVKLTNEGNLAFKFQVNIKPATPIFGVDVNSNNEEIVVAGTIDANGNFVPSEPEQYHLADVIEVYVVPAANYQSFAEIKAAAEAAATGEAPVISKLMDDPDGAAYGVLYPAGTTEGSGPVGEITYCIALRMKEEAGNEYQGLSVGDGFAVQLQATQYVHEKDSFGPNYDAGAEYANLPSAVVIPYTKSEINQINNDNDINLQTAYSFRTSEDVIDKTVEELKAYAETHPYRYWKADFVISFDKPVKEGSVTLGGSYFAWYGGDWVTPSLPMDLAANEPIRLLKTVEDATSGSFKGINYEELVTEVQKFDCGAWNNSDENKGTTMTVELRLYETKPSSDTTSNTKNEETGRYVTIGTFTYKFDSTVTNP